MVDMEKYSRFLERQKRKRDIDEEPFYPSDCAAVCGGDPAVQSADAGAGGRVPAADRL